MRRNATTWRNSKTAICEPCALGFFIRTTTREDPPTLRLVVGSRISRNKRAGRLFDLAFLPHVVNPTTNLPPFVLACKARIRPYGPINR